MALTLSRVEDYRPVPGRPDQLKLVGTNHYIRVRTAEGGPYFIQNGRVYSEGGSEITELPAWFWDEVKKINSDQLKAVKFPPEEQVSEAVALRHCEQCNSDIEPRKWGVHIAHHKRQAG